MRHVQMKVEDALLKGNHWLSDFFGSGKDITREGESIRAALVDMKDKGIEFIPTEGCNITDKTGKCCCGDV